MKPLPPPDDAIDHPDAVEVLRGWVVGEDLQVSLRESEKINRPRPTTRRLYSIPMETILRPCFVAREFIVVYG
jgi:hypothetical protein